MKISLDALILVSHKKYIYTISFKTNYGSLSLTVESHRRQQNFSQFAINWPTFLLLLTIVCYFSPLFSFSLLPKGLVTSIHGRETWIRVRVCVRVGGTLSTDACARVKRRLERRAGNKRRGWGWLWEREIERGSWNGRMDWIFQSASRLASKRTLALVGV